MVHGKTQDVAIMKKEAAEAAKEGVTLPDEKQGKRAKRTLIKATLEIDEPLGDRQVLDLKVGDYLVKALVLPDFKADLGDELLIDFPEDKIYVFDKKTGQTLL
jgi:multiple sugar transport system ATP-binding protein